MRASASCWLIRGYLVAAIVAALIAGATGSWILGAVLFWVGGALLGLGLAALSVWAGRSEGSAQYAGLLRDEPMRTASVRKA